MRSALTATLSLVLFTASAQAQQIGARCSPRVEAAAAVSPATVARLTAAISGSPMVSGACPVVRFDLVNARLVMTVVLQDGRQVARVLPSLHDAMPTLVALTATPLPTREAEADVELEAVDAPAVVRPEPTPLVSTLAAPVLVVAPTLAPVARSWQLRLAAAVGMDRENHRGALAGALDLDLLLPHWAFGLRSTSAFDLHGDRGFSGLLTAASVRRRLNLGRLQFDFGPAVGLRWNLGNDASDGLSLRLGAEASAGFLLGAGWSVFARVDGGAELFGEGNRTHDVVRIDARHDQHSDEVGFSYGFAIGLRWEVLR